MLTISLTPSTLSALTFRLSEECQAFKPADYYEKMLHALLLEFYKKLLVRCSFPKKVNRFTLSAPQAMAFILYFGNNKHSSDLSDNTILQIVLSIQQHAT